MTCLPSAPTHAMLSWATVMPLRFAMIDRASTNWKVVFRYLGAHIAVSARGGRCTYIVLEMAV
jgi:hypothetical protein